MNPINDLSLIKMYLSQIRKVKPDLVITYTIKPNVYGGFAARILHTNYAMNITGLGTSFQTDNLTKKIACFLYKRATKRAKCVFFENEGNKETPRRSAGSLCLRSQERQSYSPTVASPAEGAALTVP